MRCPLSLAYVAIGLLLPGTAAAEDLSTPLTVEGRAADSTSAPASAPRLDAADLQDWLDGYLSAALRQAKIAGAVVSVVREGRLLTSGGYGHADVAAEEPMDPARTLVRVGSIAKPFTWTAVMQLVEQGKLDLGRDVNAYLDFEIPARAGEPVTLLDLMNHRGGFEEGLREVLFTDPSRFISTEEYLKAHPRPRIFAAGAVPAYSNYGTALAGYIVERVSGVPFDEYIERHILTPLDMRRSTFRQPLPEALSGDMSQGYMRSDRPAWPFELATTAPAGSLSATADDMANFMIAHLQAGRFGDEQILKPETAERMHEASAPHPPGFATMAHGFFSADVNGRRVIGHGGDTILFHSDLNLIPEEDVGIFVAFNSRGAGDAVYGVRHRMFEDFMDRYFPASGPERDPPAIAGALAHAEQIAGHYQSSRRIETAFLKLIYLLQQAEVSANEDGTISLSSEEGRRYREIAPDLWREEGGDHTLYVSRVDGRRTIVASDDPITVLQAVPLSSNSTLNTFILLGSVSVLSLTLIAWPIGWRYRRLHGQPIRLSREALLAGRLTRLAALGSCIYLFGWFLALKPLLDSRLDAYGPSLDGLLRALQVGALIPIAGSVLGLWNAWLTVRSNRRWAEKAGSLFLAGALIGVLWIAWIGRLIGYSLEY